MNSAPRYDRRHRSSPGRPRRTKSWKWIHTVIGRRLQRMRDEVAQEHGLRRADLIVAFRDSHMLVLGGLGRKSFSPASSVRRNRIELDHVDRGCGELRFRNLVSDEGLSACRYRRTGRIV